MVFIGIWVNVLKGIINRKNDTNGDDILEYVNTNNNL
jgi:hypothetical protein